MEAPRVGVVGDRRGRDAGWSARGREPRRSRHLARTLRHAGGVDAVRYRVVVTGVVQGVGFRWSCVREAERLGVGGWVRNRADGSVEVVVEGAPSAVERLIRWCARGPRHARVVSTDITPEEPRGLAGFDVAH